MKILPPGSDHERRGFTLPELLVTICVIAILAALLMSVLQSGRTAAEATAAQNKLRQIYAATVQFTQENNNHFPRCSYANEEGANGLYFFKMKENYIADFTDSALLPYLGGSREAVEEMFTVPADKLARPDNGALKRNFSFSINFLVNLRAADENSQRQGLATIRTTEVRDPEKRGFIYEQESPDDGYCVWYIEPPARRYAGRSHVLFFDGHAELKDYDDVFSNFEMGDVVPPDSQTY
jgi:prepilin-type N-terminal cleavage/methylation domain-containing protein/prepilin-type processing-associated H-X9-DG protein